MLVYMVYEKSSGKIVHTHRAVDVAGRSATCSAEEIRRVLPANIDPEEIGIVSTEMDETPSARHMEYRVDVSTGTLTQRELKN